MQSRVGSMILRNELNYLISQCEWIDEHQPLSNSSWPSMRGDIFQEILSTEGRIRIQSQGCQSVVELTKPSQRNDLTKIHRYLCRRKWEKIIARVLMFTSPAVWEVLPWKEVEELILCLSMSNIPLLVGRETKPNRRRVIASYHGFRGE